ncbi:MAG: hybrid sensor histidine kinase/response regulator [Candidatus Krumholzibacteria bacterium]|nr:hybrid sensor histidine kinase/response regulator [Candidatus Krumholzibacteria bacterium]
MKSVFFVDDDGLLREILARALEKQNYRVTLFDSPRKLLLELDSTCPDILISDLQMPKMSGFELIESIRSSGFTFPIIVVSGHITREIEQRVRQLGVSHVLAKPIKDFSKLASLIDRALGSFRKTTESGSLDDLRLSLLTSLSHELRTPLTAIKIALDGLGAEPSAIAPRVYGQLIAISRRNVDRIIDVVEGQLELLQIAAGGVSMARRLAGVVEIIENAARACNGGRSQSIAIQSIGAGEGLFLFTDPERLQLVIKHIIDSAPGDVTIETHVDTAGESRVVLDFANTDIFGGSAAEAYLGLCGGNDHSPEAHSGHDLVYRACRRLVEALGGRITFLQDGGIERVRLQLPVFPDFDQRADLVAPVTQLHRMAMLRGRSVRLVKCRVRRDPTHADGFDAGEDHFLRLCLSSLSAEEVAVRCRDRGTYYLALIERNRDEMAKIIRDLRGLVSERGGADRIETTIHESPPLEAAGLERLLVELETIK